MLHWMIRDAILSQVARSIDPSCFMIVSQVSEVWGRGFSYGKRNSIPQD